MYTKLYNVVKYWNELLSAEKNYLHNKLVRSAVIQSQNAKIKNKMNIYFAFSECPDPHQLKFVQFFSTQPISTYFTLQRYIALVNTIFSELCSDWLNLLLKNFESKRE